MSKQNSFYPLPLYKYKQRFGIGPGKKHDKDKMRAAYKKAWECRDFEIDKFWSRATYFWGFIAAIFAGYIAVVNSSSSSISEQSVDTHLDVVLLMLGLVFSFAWLLVIKGSKQWQENWEAHIDMLEDEITGPLYKTVYCKKGKPFYSVSKISECMAKVVIVAWVILLFNYIISFLEQSGLCIINFFTKDSFITFVIVVGGIVSIILLFTKCKSAGNGCKTNFLDGQDKCFIDRKSKENRA